jgi:hypothetical protein
MFNLEDLDLLAQLWPVIFGRSLDLSSLSAVFGSSAPRSGRSDHIDNKSSDIQSALRTLDRLMLFASQPTTQRYAEVLLYARVYSGQEARRSGTVYLELGLWLSPAQRKKPLIGARREQLIAQGRILYEEACAVFTQENNDSSEL